MHRNLKGNKCLVDYNSMSKELAAEKTVSVCFMMTESLVLDPLNPFDKYRMEEMQK